jgi:hypothetical protein
MTQIIDERLRITKISLIDCRIVIRDNANRELISKKFPLPQKTDQARDLIRSIIYKFLDFLEESRGYQSIYRIEVSFYNVPEDILKFIKKDYDSKDMYAKTFLGKLPPLGLPLIISSLKRKFEDKIVIKVNGAVLNDI